MNFDRGLCRFGVVAHVAITLFLIYWLATNLTEEQYLRNPFNVIASVFVLPSACAWGFVGAIFVIKWVVKGFKNDS